MVTGHILRTIPTGRATEIVQTVPDACPQGHPLRPPNVQVTFGSPDPDAGPNQGGARIIGWRCWTCQSVTWENGTVTRVAGTPVPVLAPAHPSTG